MGHRRVIDPAGPFGEFSVKKGSSVRRGQDLNLAQTTGDKFIRFFFSLLISHVGASNRGQWAKIACQGPRAGA